MFQILRIVILQTRRSLPAVYWVLCAEGRMLGNNAGLPDTQNLVEGQTRDTQL